MAKEAGARKTDVLQGTLDLMVLQSLNTMGLQHGYGIARRIEQISESTLKLNEDTVYASLMRLQLTGLITSRWARQRTTAERSSTRSPSVGSGSCRPRPRTGTGSPG
jgi:DNA-binding PadR family transcriptional regulator